MGHYVGYNIRGPVYTAPQMMALRRIIAGHSTGEGDGPRRTVNVLKREGVVTEPQLGAFQVTEFGRQVADIADLGASAFPLTHVTVEDFRKLVRK